MDYAASLQYLRQLGDEVLTMKFGLENIRSLLRSLEQPQGQFPSVLVGGTNGKGSVATFLHRIVTAAGVRAGLFTSPHLVSVRERFRVGDSVIDEREFAECLTRVVDAISDTVLPGRPTYFETLTAAAFLFFHRRGVDLAVLEVGMGGRWDSTNVVDPLLSVVAPVAIDHEQYLGTTLARIAGEKAGIMRPSRLCLCAPQPAEAAEVLAREAAKQGARLRFLNSCRASRRHLEGGRYGFEWDHLEVELPVCGSHQVDNAVLAIEAARALPGFCFDSAAIKAGIESARWPGRIERRAGRPELILDGAHNAAAAVKLAEFLQEHTSGPRHLVFSALADKRIEAMLAALEPLFDRIYLTRIDSPRGAALEDLQALCPRGIVVVEPKQALDRAREGCATLVAAGSLYLVGQLSADLEE